jgi:two-component SAPR family response regulator
VSLLGPVSLRHGDHVAGLSGRRAQELLCYAVMQADRPLRREVLAERLWGEYDEPDPRKQLRQALWHLQQAFESIGARDILDSAGEWIHLRRPDLVHTDVAAIESAFQATSGREWNADSLAQARQAVRLYQGDLLESCYLGWCVLERERCRTMYLALLDRLVGWAESNGDFVAGLSYGAAILREDRAHERTHRSLMRMLAEAGDRTSALRQYQRCRAALDEELGVQPSRATERLRQSLCHDDRGSGSLTDPPMSGDVLSELTQVLEQAQALLRRELARRATG